MFDRCKSRHPGVRPLIRGLKCQRDLNHNGHHGAWWRKGWWVWYDE